MAKYCEKCGRKLKKGKCKKCEKKARNPKKTPFRKFLKVLIILIIIGILGAGGFGYYRMHQQKSLDIAESESKKEKITPTDIGSMRIYTSNEKNLVMENVDLAYQNDEVLVTLAESADKSALENFIAKYKGRIVGELPLTKDYQVVFDQSYQKEELEKIAADLEAQDWIEMASLNWKTQIQENFCPNDELWKDGWDEFPGGGNWGLEAIHVPQAWEYRDQMSVVNIGIIDDMFDTAHTDLHFAESPLGNALANQAVENGKIEDSSHGTHTSGTTAATTHNKNGISGIAWKKNLYGVSVRGLETKKYTGIQDYKIALYYLIVEKGCNVINYSMGNQLRAFNASRENKLNGTWIWTESLTKDSKSMSVFLKRIISQGYNQFVICQSSGNSEGNSDNYKFFLSEGENPNYYLSYSRYLNYLNDKNPSQEDKDLYGKYKQSDVEKRLEWGNVDAKYNSLFTFIDDPEIRSHIVVVGAIENKGWDVKGTWFEIGPIKVNPIKINFLRFHIGGTPYQKYEIADFSQNGDRVDVVAPGVDIESCVRRGYDKMDGTSMATPHVTGTAALIFSANPDLTGSQVKEILVQTAVDEYGPSKKPLIQADEAVESAIRVKNKGNSSSNKKEEKEKESEIINTSSGKKEIVLVLDTSGSMDGEPLEKTKEASTRFLESVFGKSAMVGIVTYDENAQKISGFSNELSVLENDLEEIETNGSTNIESGLQMATDMLEESEAQKKIIVLMSDGEPNRGLLDQELIEYADSIKEENIEIFTLGFFEQLSNRANAQYLMEEIASDGCHYEVDDPENLAFFFSDIADLINGQRFMYLRVECPVDVYVSHDGEQLDSSLSDGKSQRTEFGTLTFEENENEEDLTKVLRLKCGEEYDIEISGYDSGKMDYTIGFMDEDGTYSDFRKFKNISINRKTKIDTKAAETEYSELNIDEDGDGKYEKRLRAGKNERGKEVEDRTLLYVGLISAGLVLGMLCIFIALKKKKRKY